MLPPSHDTVCQGESVTFTDSTTTGGTPVSYKIKLFHVATGAQIDVRFTNPASFTFSYAAPYDAGLYRIEDSVVDANGCASTYTRYVYVRVTPHITAVTMDTVYRCAPPFTVRFGSTVAPGPTSAYTYRWAFGGGAAATTSGVGLSSTTHSYTAVGTFSPQLRITDAYGCTNDTTLTGSVSVASPTIRITKNADSGCAPIRVAYTVDLLAPAGLSYLVDSVTYGDTLDRAPCLGSGCADSAHTYPR
ncbi:MAG: PKD domain-containing protein, partial [Chitinophagia bacterium]|nr:PKD domain-containing protein [Chitinophagia bacterium]